MYAYTTLSVYFIIILVKLIPYYMIPPHWIMDHGSAWALVR
jgi:hypothetical protein